MKKKKEKKRETIRFNPSLLSGLTYLEVEHRQKNGETNYIKNSTEKTYLEIILRNFFSFFNILMVIIALILLIFVGLEIFLNLTFLVLAISNTLIGTIQECKSKRALKKLKLLSEIKNTVVRNGVEEQISTHDIVLDDIIILTAGDQIPADCIIRENKILEINESLLTGESRAVRKTFGDSLLAGSFVISGTAKVQVNAVGKNTYLYSIEEKSKVFKKPESKLILGINKIIKILASIAIPLAFITLINQTLRLGIGDYKEIIKNAGFIIPYMIPAGMILLSSVSMMTGVINLSKKKVLAQDLSSVEALSRIDTLCLDKTGTLTDGTMTVEKTIIKGQGDIEAIISSYMGAFENSNQTSKAIINKHGNEKIIEAIETMEFSSARKYSAVRFKNGDFYAMGAPEYLMPENEKILNFVKEHSEKGSRVILMIKILDGKFTEDGLKIKKAKEFAIFVIRDNIRTEVPDAMKWFNENGVDIKVISGDNIGTVSYIAKQSGIKDWDKCVDMSKITKNDNLEKIVMENSIFGRVSPEQKAEIVDILKKNGRNVAMTGDGINDIISLKKADCAIALANGAPATKNIANLVLLDSNFSNMKEAVFEGRRVVNNVQRSSTLFVMKDFLWMLISIWPILFGLNFDLEPTVMTAVNIFLTGIGSLLLAFEPDKRKIEGNFVKNVTSTGIVAGIYMFLPIIFVYIFSIIEVGFNVSAISDYIQNQMFPVISICIAIAGFVIFFKICQPFTKYRKILYIGILLLVIFLLILIPDYFLKRGTDFMSEIIAEYGTSISGILQGMVSSLFRLETYSVFSSFQWILIATFLLFSTTIYKITDKFVSKWLNITLFNPKKFGDD